MRTFKLTLAYDGTAYAGWQCQPNGVTLQESLERALAKITGKPLRTVASGRTDAGVHARGQVVSFASDCDLPTEVLERALNAELPRDMVVSSVVEVPAGFHAIRDARRKCYRYAIRDGRLPDVFQRHFAWQVRQRLDVAAMHRGAVVDRHARLCQLRDARFRSRNQRSDRVPARRAARRS